MTGPVPLTPIVPPDWVGASGAVTSDDKDYATLKGVTAPDSIMSQETRDLLGNEFDQQIAGSGGIESIVARETIDGNLTVQISGRVQPGTLARTKKAAGPDKPLAPSFNNKTGSLFKADELGGLSADDWERAHLWGPGFGDEAAAGLWYASEEVNQDLQNKVVEGFIRTLAEQAEENGGHVDVTVTGERFDSDELPSEHSRGEFLKAIRYDVTLVDGDGNQTPLYAEFELNPPPDGSASHFGCDQQTAVIMDDLSRQFDD